MEQPVAVNEFSITEALFSEAARQPLAKKYGRLTLAAACMLAVGWGVLFALAMRQQAPAALPALNGLVFLAVLLWMRLALPKTESRRAWKQQQSAGCGRRVRFYSDRFVVEGGSKPTEFRYSEVTAARATQNLLILRCGGREVLLLKDGFTKGGAADVPCEALKGL